MYEVIGQFDGPYNVIAGGEGLRTSAGTISGEGDDLSSVSKQFPIFDDLLDRD